MSIATQCRSGALVVLAATASLSPARGDEGDARVETTVLVRINQADHEGVDGSTLRVSPRSLHVAWKAQDEHGAFWTVDGRRGKPYASVESLVFSEDGEHYAYFAERDGKTLLVVDDRERELTGLRPDHGTLRLLPGARAALVAETTNQGGVPIYAVWIDGGQPRRVQSGRKALGVGGTQRARGRSHRRRQGGRPP
jgi:hypothetical protein